MYLGYMQILQFGTVALSQNIRIDPEQTRSKIYLDLVVWSASSVAAASHASESMVAVGVSVGGRCPA